MNEEITNVTEEVVPEIITEVSESKHVGHGKYVAFGAAIATVVAATVGGITCLTKRFKKKHAKVDEYESENEIPESDV